MINNLLKEEMGASKFTRRLVRPFETLIVRKIKQNSKQKLKNKTFESFTNNTTKRSKNIIALLRAKSLNELKLKRNNIIRQILPSQ